MTVPDSMAVSEWRCPICGEGVSVASAARQEKAGSWSLQFVDLDTYSAHLLTHADHPSG